jgi:pyruvate, orthophosphate dikinase
MGVPVEKIKSAWRNLHEFNPMLGLRGCRLGIVFPEITEMQTRAIIEAAAQVQKEGIPVKPEIMIVLVGFPKELQLQLEVVNRRRRRNRAGGEENQGQVFGRHDD